MLMFDAVTSAKKQWKELDTMQSTIIKLQLYAHKHYVEECNKILRKMYAEYQNPIAVKEILDGILKEHQEDLTQRGLLKPELILVKE